MTRHFSFLIGLLVLATPAARAEAPLTHSKTLLEEFKRIRSEKDMSAIEKAANEKIIDKLDHAFDFNLITSKLLLPREDKFTAEQKELFRSKFHDVVRSGAFVDTGDFFRKATIEWQPATDGTDGVTTVPIHVTVIAEDTDMVVSLLWKQVDGELRVVDVLLDGDSLVKDYQNQVARIVDKKGVQGLFDNLDERKANIRKGKVK